MCQSKQPSQSSQWFIKVTAAAWPILHDTMPFWPRCYANVTCCNYPISAVLLEANVGRLLLVLPHVPLTVYDIHVWTEHQMGISISNILTNTYIVTCMANMQDALLLLVLQILETFNYWPEVSWSVADTQFMEISVECPAFLVNEEQVQEFSQLILSVFVGIVEWIRPGL